jgi:hypothetical protein
MGRTSRILFQNSLLAAIVSLNMAWAVDAADPVATIDRKLIVEEFDVAKDGDDLLLPVRFRDKTYLFVLDTGASFTAYDLSLRPLLGKPIKTMKVTAFGKNVPLEFFQSPHASVGKLSIHTSVPVATVDFKRWREISGTEIYGVLGMDFLRHQIVHIDRDLGKVLFLKGGRAYPGDSVTFFYSDDGTPEIELNLQSSKKEWFSIDTGDGGMGSGGLSSNVFQSLIKGKDLELLKMDAFHSNLSGTSRIETGIARQVKLGPFTHRNLVFCEEGSNVLGLNYWSRYVATFDFPAQKAYLKEGREYNLPDEINRSGLHILRIDGRTCVHSVDKDSPASAKGIAAEDVIVKFDGKSPDQISMFSLRRLLSSPGKSVHIVIRRGKEERELTLELSK